MVACGPFTFKNSMGYQGLLDFLALVRKEGPQVVIFLGPFLDMNNSEVFSGELWVENPDKTKGFVTHEDLFKDIMTTIQRELKDVKTKVIVVPSHKDITHFHPLPQPAFADSIPATFFAASNPCTIQLNDLSISIINTDVVKDMCPCIIAKNMEPAKIDLSLRGILEQRLFYPMYPSNSDTPIEYEQVESLYIETMPDILIAPSDLMQFIKRVEGGCLCINPGSIIKNDSAGTYCSINIDPFDVRGYRGDPSHVADTKVTERVRVEINNI